MKISKIAPLFTMLPVIALAGTGCASGSDDGTQSGTGAATVGASAGAEFSAAVGAVVVNGEKICTSALVDVDRRAEVTINGNKFEIAGRQVLLGGACLGKLSPDFTGVAAFVTHKGETTISTPILAVDFKDKEKLGFAVGILANQPDGATALPLASADDVRGAFASADAGAHVATVLRADRHGFLVGASLDAHAGFDVALQGKCASLKFGAEVGIHAAASFGASDEGISAAALVRINGKLHFAAHIDGKCVVKEVEQALDAVATETLNAVNDIGAATNSIGTGTIVGVYQQPCKTGLDDCTETVRVRLNASAPVLRINSEGKVSGTLSKVDAAGARGAEMATCNKVPLGIIGGPCELAPDGGLSAGEYDLDVNLHATLVPKPSGQRVVISTGDSAKFPETHGDGQSAPSSDPSSGGQ